MASERKPPRQVAQVVLLSSNFAAMPVVEEGRRVINNIQRAAALHLVKNIMSFFLAPHYFVCWLSYPFVPIQLHPNQRGYHRHSLFSAGAGTKPEIVKGRFMQNVLRRALPGGLTNIVLIVGIELLYLCLYLSESHPIHPGYSADGSGWTAGAVLYFQAAGLETLDFAWR